jgi:Icc-related predicted phosphoesterase
MSFTLTKPYSRLWSLDAGVVMVATDLHGDRDAYRRYRNRFVDLQAEGLADCLILTGDLVHLGRLA